MVNINETLQRRRNYVYSVVNERIDALRNNGKLVSKRDRSKIYKQAWKEAKGKFKLK